MSGGGKKYEEIHFVDSTKAVWNYSFFNEENIRNFQKGTLYNAYDYFGSHQIEVLEKTGFYFSVWAPNATYISVIGEFNNWDPLAHPLFVRLDNSGIWEGFIPDLEKGELYKYHINGYKGVITEKGDPYGNYWEIRPATATITWDLQNKWDDKSWMKSRKKHNSLKAPWSVYEVHLASWMRPDKNDEESYNSYEFFTYISGFADSGPVCRFFSDQLHIRKIAEYRFIKVLYKCDRFEISVTTIFIGFPLPFFP